MTSARPPRASPRAPARSRRVESPVKLAELSARLAEAEETLRAIGSGEVDAVVVAGKSGDQVFTLQGADHVYRLLIESMNEGALTLTTGMVITYANQCFARMIRRSLEQVTGTSFLHLLSVGDRVMFQSLIQEAIHTGSKVQLSLKSGPETSVPVQVSIRALPTAAANQVTIGMVVTDLTETRRTEELLRSLTHRVVQRQEAERGSVALELHDHVTQLLCAVLFRCQALIDELSERGGPSLKEAIRLQAMLGRTTEEVERISRNLRPGVLDQLGLEAVLHATGREFEAHSGLKLALTVVPLDGPLRASAGLAFYRILQEALKNVEQHARARHVSVFLRQQGTGVLLTIKDDGHGFDPAKRGLGLLGMRERAAAVGGTVSVTSERGTGTEIEANIPLVATTNLSSKVVPVPAPDPVPKRKREPRLRLRRNGPKTSAV